MVMMIEPIAACIDDLKSKRTYDDVIYMSPDGIILDQPKANTFSTKKNLLILCGHYKGVDERVREHFITKEISIGDYVLMGGELPALVVSEAVLRHVPGVLGKDESAGVESFSDNMLEYPQYTKPEVWKLGTRDKGLGTRKKTKILRVPKVLLSGNHAKIDEWRKAEALKRTKKRRPDLLKK